jgi:hypothetical protein
MMRIHVVVFERDFARIEGAYENIALLALVDGNGGRISFRGGSEC